MPGWLPRRPSGNTARVNYLRQIQSIVSEKRLNSVAGQRVHNTTSGQHVLPSRQRSGGGSITVAQFVVRVAEFNHLVCREVELEYLASGKKKPSSIGTTDIYVAKPWALQCAVESVPAWASGLTWDAQTITYARDDSEPYMVFTSAINWPDADILPDLTEEQASEGWNEFNETADSYGAGQANFEIRQSVVRTVTQDGISETQRVIPVWKKGNIIDAVELETPGETDAGQVTDAGQPIEWLMIPDGRQWARI
jgi:hypothetical protein